MTKYYYLGASLPYLVFGSKPPLTTDEFLEECRKWLTPADLGLLRDLQVATPPEGSNDLLTRWLAFRQSLRFQVVKALTGSKDPQLQSGEDSVKKIVEQPNPLQRELAFERIKWDYLDSQEFHYQFDINSLVIYLEKLKILDRLAGFDSEKGKEKFDKVCEVNYG